MNQIWWDESHTSALYRTKLQQNFSVWYRTDQITRTFYVSSVKLSNVAPFHSSEAIRAQITSMSHVGFSLRYRIKNCIDHNHYLPHACFLNGYVCHKVEWWWGLAKMDSISFCVLPQEPQRQKSIFIVQKLDHSNSDEIVRVVFHCKATE